MYWTNNQELVIEFELVRKEKNRAEETVPKGIFPFLKRKRKKMKKLFPPKTYRIEVGYFALTSLLYHASSLCKRNKE